MSRSDERFYLLKFKDRPAFWGDIGSQLRIEGLVVGGMDAKVILMLPGNSPDPMKLVSTPVVTLSLEEWSEFIQRSDDPEILVGPVPDGQKATAPKIFVRKMRFQISGEVQQKIWAADGFACVYCGAKMGQSLMTIDHFIPLENGGVNNETNYLTACKKCNKRKGNQDPAQWMETCYRWLASPAGKVNDVLRYIADRNSKL